MGTTSVSPDTLSVMFDDNIDGASRIVLDASPYTLSTNNVPANGGSKAFDMVTKFQQPFPYSVDNGNLIIDWTHLGVSRSTRNDFLVSPDSSAHFVGTSSLDSSVATEHWGGSIVQFTFVPVGDLNYDGLLNRAGRGRISVAGAGY